MLRSQIRDLFVWFCTWSDKQLNSGVYVGTVLVGRKFVTTPPIRSTLQLSPYTQSQGSVLLRSVSFISVLIEEIQGCEPCISNDNLE